MKVRIGMAAIGEAILGITVSHLGY